MPNETPKPLLNPFQRQCVGAGATALAIAVLLVFAYGVFLLLRGFVTTFSGVLLPLAVAGILATLLKPLVKLIQQRLRLSRPLSIAVLCAAVGAVVTLLAWWIFPPLLSQFISLMEGLARQLSNASDWLVGWLEANPQHVESLKGAVDVQSLESWASEGVNYLRAALSASLAALGSAGSGVLGFVGQVAMWIVTPIYLIILLNSDEEFLPRMSNHLSFIPKRFREDLLYLVNQFCDILIAYFRGQVTIAVLTGIILAIGFSVVGVKAGLLIGFVAGLANLIPYLGTTAGVLTIMPWAYFQEDGGPGRLLAAAIVFGGTQLIQDYVLTPRIMGDRTGLGPMTIIFALFFWGIALEGILGVILAIPLTAFFTVFWRLAKTRYLPNYQCGLTQTP